MRSSESPKRLLKKIFGFDVEKKAFWMKGIRMIEELVDEAEVLYGETQKKK